MRNLFKKCTYAILGAITIFGMSVSANVDLKALDEFVANSKTIEADFRQDVYDGYGGIIQSTTGKFLSKKPDSYRWETLTPDHTVLVSNGKKVWHYDEELEQVTVHTNEDSNFTPIVVLATDVASLQSQFDISMATKSAKGLIDVLECRKENVTCYELVPKDEDSDFTKVYISFAKGKLIEIVLYDQLQNITRIHFSDMQENNAINSEKFNFAIPKGVDVVKN